MERGFKKMSNQHFHFAILLYTDSHPIIQTFYHSRHTLAAGRIFGCEVQSPAVDAENFWDKGRTKRLFPMTGIFLSPLSKAYSCQKVCVIGGRLILHRKITSSGQGQTARKQGKQKHSHYEIYSIINRNGKHHNGKVDVALVSYYSPSIDTTLVSLAPYRPGMYAWEFKHSDSHRHYLKKE